VVLVAVGGTNSSIAAEPVPPEKLLAKDSVFYLRYDGLETHRKGYDQTVIARLMREDLGELVQYVVKLVQEGLGPGILSERLLAGIEPAQLLKLQEAAKGLPDALRFVYHQGFVIGVEVIDVSPPRMQATVIFPGAAKNEKHRASLLGVVRLASKLGEVELEEKSIDGRKTLQFKKEPTKFACWEEGDHLVLTVGTEDVARTLALAEGRQPDLTQSRLFQQPAGLKTYETWMRGYIDLQASYKIAEKIKVAKTNEKEFASMTALQRKLGLTELRSLSFHSGCDGPHLRRTVMLETGNRTGLLRLLNTPEAIAPEQLPSLPADLTSLYATRVDWGTTGKALFEGIEEIRKVMDPAAAPKIPTESLKEVEKLQNSLGGGIVLYNAPSNGAFWSGYTLALEVKDAPQLKASIEEIIRTSAAETGTKGQIKTRKYRGVDLHTVPFAQGMFVAPTFTVHNGWLVMSLYPQSVQAYLMRSTGQGFSSWRPPEHLTKTIQETMAAGSGRAKVVSLSYSDPRPIVETILTYAPLLAGFVQMAGAGHDFDLALIPNPKSITDLIGPSISVGFDDGRMMRWERVSTFPLEVSFMEIYGLMALAGAGSAFSPAVPPPFKTEEPPVTEAPGVKPTPEKPEPNKPLPP
jgi:hypothetical protein